MKRDPTLKIGCSLWERGSRVGMTGVFYSRDARLSISSSPMIVWARNLFSCILQATSSKLLWYQAIFIVGIIHSQLPSSKFNMPILCAQSLRLPSSKFKMPILCTQSLRLPSSKFKGPILSTQSLRLLQVQEANTLLWCLTKIYYPITSPNLRPAQLSTKVTPAEKCDHVFGKKRWFGCLWFVNMDRGS